MQRMTLNCNGQLLNLTEPKVMGICNITNDSFFEGSRVNTEKDLLGMVESHLENGADIIDIGGMSSRPGAEEIPLEDEIRKVTWGIKVIRSEFSDCIISIDTYRSDVVKACADLGAGMINDISGGNLDDKLIETVGETNLPYVLMHMRQTPRTMQVNPKYEEGVVLYLLNYFKSKIVECQKAQIKDIIVDPGFGFGKTIEDNYTLLSQLKSFKLFDLPIMVGISRKSMIYKPLNTSSDKALNGTSALHMIALQNGAKILRVHDVKEAKECVDLFRIYSSV